VDRLFCLGDAPQSRVFEGNRRTASSQFLEGVWGAMKRGHSQLTAVEQRQVTELGLADARCTFQDGLKDRIELPGRARDDAQHVGGGGLLLQRLAQLLEQTRVLDGDHSLVGKILYQFDLLIVEWADLLAVNADSADKLVLLEHRDDEKRASPG
jgi:hypothetical protein